MYQKCPVCDGTGLVSKPPWIAGDVNEWVDSSSVPYTCKTCLGSGIIEMPPQQGVQGEPVEPATYTDTWTIPSGVNIKQG